MFCRVSTSVVHRLPKPRRRVRFPYPAPKNKRRRMASLIFWSRTCGGNRNELRTSHTRKGVEAGSNSPVDCCVSENRPTAYCRLDGGNMQSGQGFAFGKTLVTRHLARLRFTQSRLILNQPSQDAKAGLIYKKSHRVRGAAAPRKRSNPFLRRRVRRKKHFARSRPWPKGTGLGKPDG